MSHFRLVFYRISNVDTIFTLIFELAWLLQKFKDKAVELLLNLWVFEYDVVEFLMEVFLRVEIEVIMFFSFIEKLLFHSILASLQIFSYFELLSSQIVHEVNVSLKKVFGHSMLYFYFIFILITNHKHHELIIQNR